MSEKFCIEGRGNVEQAAPDLLCVGVQPVNRVEKFGRVVAYHLDSLIKQIEAARCVYGAQLCRPLRLDDKIAFPGALDFRS